MGVGEATVGILVGVLLDADTLTLVAGSGQPSLVKGPASCGQRSDRINNPVSIAVAL